MRVGELSRRTGVPVPTIKYYLREGLLPAGELTCPNQAQYDEAHVRRLRLLRALLEVGGLSIATARRLLTALDAPGLSLPATLDLAQHAVAPRPRPGERRTEDSAAGRAAAEAAAAWVAERGWLVHPGGAACVALAQVFQALRELGQEDLLGILDEYAAAAERLAAAELALLGRRADPGGRLEGAVLGTVLGDTLLASMRRLAQEDASRRVFVEAPAETET
ncbi:MerR family transcriptional regulator [Kitasatospora sp. NBC_01250]|uniref:MerR family transcriptional regulator n=1 Tax=unclassified Kitasatospora TaxID=2633591 RepID=UPI002E1156CA|nr:MULTISPECIES: MerR family transcriptional regulator [unclassified Kitasatospora]WSJ67975.1 MerR family transcriptional regulator [Kitasatospora sp. NBC_01302]